MNLILLLIFVLIYIILIVGIKDLSGYFNYLSKYIFTSFYHIIFSIPLIYVIIYFFDYKIKFTYHVLLLLILLFSFIIIFKLNIKKKVLRLDHRFLITKFSEIIFQQSFILLFVLIFYSYFIEPFLSIIMFTLFFSLIHLLSLFTIPRKRALIYTFISFFGGLFFSYFIIYFYNGVFFSFALHYLFYIFLAVYTHYVPKSAFVELNKKELNG